MTHDARPWPDYARLVARAVVGASVLAALGWLPTVRLGAPAAAGAMAAGIGISLAASLCGAAPIAFSRDPAPTARHTALMGAMAIRMGVTLALFAALALGGFTPRGALAIWTGISYITLLAVETAGAVALGRKREGR